MADRLSIWGGRGGVQTIEMNSKSNATFDKLFDNLEFMREELVIARHTMEQVVSEDYEAPLEDINTELDSLHEIREM